ncbi:MAG: pantoate--beta-alanine ligase, partial [Alphaproteobacteria bacterium]|nr:pantoate--beta-alanine ligase [Alphaproteobacteria bacterium]
MPMDSAADLALATVRTVADLRRIVARWRQGGKTVALVPTMGALHEGHLSLMQLARQHCDRVVATIFVNPQQFAPHEDFGAYPRQEARDAALLAGEGVDLLYAPLVTEMYPEGFSTTVSVAGVSEGLCGTFRPQMFPGVATVVTKLLLQAGPDAAIFGEKDYQQLQVIRRLVRDLDIPVRIIGGPTVREADGLAMSSRNAYLTPAERAVANRLYAILCRVADAAQAGTPPAAEALATARESLLAAGFRSVDYIELRDAETLAPLDRLDRPA